MKRRFSFISLCLCSCLLASAQESWDVYVRRGEPWYDFVQDGVYYKFGTVPDNGYYIDTSYTDENGNEVKDGFYTGLPSEGEILWVVGKWEWAVVSDMSLHDNVYIQVSTVYNMWYDRSIENLYIPDSVLYEGKKYAVKGLAKDAFLGAALNSLRLPECLEYIMEPAFFTETPAEVPTGIYVGNIVHIPESVKYFDGYSYYTDLHIYKYYYDQKVVIPENMLYLRKDAIHKEWDDLPCYITYPKNAVYGGHLVVPNLKGVVLPEKMKHLFGKNYPSDVLVIPDNGEIQIYDSGIGGGTNRYIKTIYSYAPIIRDHHKGFGLQSFVGSEPVYAEKTLYVLPGRKAAYAEEWPDLMAGAEYSPVGLTEKRLYSEDHIIEISREEMDARVEAAGFPVPTAVSEVEVNPSKKVEEAIFTLDGRRWSTLQKGVNIVRQNDGTTKKVYVR